MSEHDEVRPMQTIESRDREVGLNAADWKAIDEGLRVYDEYGPQHSDQVYRILARMSLVSPEKFLALPFVQELTPEKFHRDFYRGKEMTGSRGDVFRNDWDDRLNRVLVYRQLQSRPDFQAKQELATFYEISDNQMGILCKATPLNRDGDIAARLKLLYPDRALPLDELRQHFDTLIDQLRQEGNLAELADFQGEYQILFGTASIDSSDTVAGRQRLAALRLKQDTRGTHKAWDMSLEAQRLALQLSPTINVPARVQVSANS